MCTKLCYADIFFARYVSDKHVDEIRLTATANELPLSHLVESFSKFCLKTQYSNIAYFFK